MKKNILFFVLIMIIGMKVVDAGTVSWQRSERLDDTHFRFYIETHDLEINYLEAYMSVDNGFIRSVTASGDWNVRQGQPYIFTHDGIVSGNSELASVIIELTGNAQYNLSGVKTAAYRCSEHQGYFGPTGNLLNFNEYKKQCYSNDTSLNSLQVSSGVLQPSFQKNIRNYTLVVSNNVSRITFTPTLSDSNANIKSGTTCDLNVGNNNCSIVVEAHNGDIGTYTVIVTRKDVVQSSDNTLKSLGVNVGTLNPSFRSDIKNYTMNVGNNVSNIIFNPVVNNASAKIISGTNCALNVGSNTCNIVVEAENQSRITYTVQVTREENKKSSDASLKGLSVNHGTLSPEFHPNIKNYVLNVEKDIEEIMFTPILSSNLASVSGTTCKLSMGVNTCNLVVTAEDGTTNTISIIATRVSKEEPITKDFVSVSDLDISIGQLIPNFQPDIFSYIIHLKEKTDWIDFTYVVHYEKENGYQKGETYRCNLDSNNMCKLVVSSYDQTNQKTYEFKVEYDNGTSSEVLNPDEVENPQTGDGISTGIIFLLVSSVFILYFVLKKKNKIQKI